MTTDTAFAPAPEDLAAYATLEHAAPAGVATLHGLGAGAALAAGDDPALVTGIAVVKPGFYNGYFEVTRDDLDAWVARFDELVGTFRPPLRLDHSWDVLSVIGRFVALRVENRPDESIGGTIVPMLVGDVRLNGTPEENVQTRAWIKSGKLDERSSEFYPYRTNAGADYPSIFAGCAFVDIPAVEGLTAITLHRATLTSTRTDTPEGTTMPQDQEPTVVEPVVVEPVEPAVVEPVVVPDPDELPTLGDPDPEPDPEPEPADQGDAGDLAAALASQGVNLSREQAVALEAEITRRANLRTEADQRIARFRTKGVMPLKVADKLEALLRHPEAGVRDTVAEFLELAHPPVKLRTPAGVAGGEATREDGAPSPTELAAMDFDEYTEAWAALTSEQRNAPEYRAAYREA